MSILQLPLMDMRACQKDAFRGEFFVHLATLAGDVRATAGFGGAAASIGSAKRQRIVLAARHYLMRLRTPPPCRFDVVTVEYGHIDWLRAAFEAG